MRSDRKKPPDTTAREVRVVRGGAGREPSEASRKQIVRITRKAGNDQFGAALKTASGSRDSMLEFIAARLESMHGLQQKELRELRNQFEVREWYRKAAKGLGGYHLPDATRFHEAARLYKQAGVALAAGRLGRGAQLLERAMEAERAALRSLPKQIQEETTQEERAEPVAPAGSVGIAPSAAAPAIPLPNGLRTADLILNIEDAMEHVPERRRQGFQWWKGTEEEEEEDDEEDG